MSKLIKTRTPYKLVGSDFSQQEVRVLAELSQDPMLIEAYSQNKDIYATVASGVYHMDYWDCMEHHEDGSPNPEGKKRRASCKSIVLGIMYSRGAAAIAEQIHSTREEAQKIVDSFFNSFPRVKQWMDELLEKLKQTGYVEDFYGRRRRLPDINLPAYEVSLMSGIAADENFNPFFGCQDRRVKDKLVLKWENILKKAIEDENAYRQSKNPSAKFTEELSNKKYEQLALEAKKDGVLIQANTARIAQAVRQCVNSAIQGSSATMTKIAMIKILQDEELKKYGFKLCIGVHDELIGQCKAKYAEAGANRLCEIMKTCVKDKMKINFKCDPSITTAWYEDEVSYQLQDTYKELSAEGMSDTDIKKKLYTENCEFLPEQIDQMLQFS